MEVKNFREAFSHISQDYLAGTRTRRQESLRISSSEDTSGHLENVLASQQGAVIGLIPPILILIKEIGQEVFSNPPLNPEGSGYQAQADLKTLLIIGIITAVAGALVDNFRSWQVGRRDRLGEPTELNDILK